MASKASRKKADKLMDDKERLLREHPGLKYTYDQFRKDFETYKKLTASKKGTSAAGDYAIFGASFVKE